MYYNAICNSWDFNDIVYLRSVVCKVYADNDDTVEQPLLWGVRHRTTPTLMGREAWKDTNGEELRAEVI